MTSSRRVVLYYPERGDPRLGQPYSADLIPLEFLHICAPAMEAGFEFDIIDSMVEPDPMGKLWKKLPGAMAFGSTCIVGYQVADGTEVARQVREKYPQLPIIWGGWFPSVAPELFLRSNLADAVCLGQGELTFRDWLVAVRDGKPFDDIPGMALWRDGKLHKTPWREVISLDDLPAPRFDLIDVDQYLEIQERQASTAKVRYRFPDPPGFDMHNPYRALSYFSSYGCPEPCSFCCSPMVTQRRWKALAAETLVDRIEELKRTHRFDVLRFQDANFGVHEKRVREFAQLLVDRKLNIWWNASIEVETIVKFSDETLDLLAESGCHMMWVGAETASAEMQAYIRKGIQQGNVDIAMRRMYERGISIGLFWIIGYPDETEESMRATLTLAAEIKTRYPSCTSEVLLYRPMPGTESGDHAARNGYEMPLEFETWGSMVDYKFANRTFEQLPPSIKRDYHRYTYLVPWFDGLVRGQTLYHRFLRVMAGWRLRHQIYDWTLEFKAYDIAKRIGRSMGLIHGPKLENRAAGVSIEGTTHNVRDAAAMPNS